MILLDTDIFTLFTFGDTSVHARIEACADAEVLAVTLITRMEVLRGRSDSIFKAVDGVQLKRAVLLFQQCEAAWDSFEFIAPDEAAQEHFDRLLKQKRTEDAAWRHAERLHCLGQ